MADPILIIGTIAIFLIIFYKIIEENPKGLQNIVDVLRKEKPKDGILQEEKKKDVARDQGFQQTTDKVSSKEC